MVDITQIHPICYVEELAHTAEIGLRVQAPTPDRLFACTGAAMFALTGAMTNTDLPGHTHRLTITAPDMGSLLVDWLSELLYLFEVTAQVFFDCRVVTWSPTELTAELVGRPSVTPLTMHIKAVTYHDLMVVERADGWTAQVIFDI